MAKRPRSPQVSIESKATTRGEYLVIKIPKPPRIVHVGAQLEAKLPGFIGFRPHFQRVIEEGLTQYLDYFDQCFGQVCALASAAFEKQPKTAPQTATRSSAISQSAEREHTNE